MCIPESTHHSKSSSAWSDSSHLEDVGPEGGVGELHDVGRPHQVEPRLVLVHRVQDRLTIVSMLNTLVSKLIFQKSFTDERYL